MCLLLLALDAHPDYALVLAANRDEFYERPTAPAAFWQEFPDVLAGRDLRAGGTWLGLDRRGRVAAVTNYRQGTREAAAPRSRGLLVSEYLTAEPGGRAHAERVKREAGLYNGFNLICGDAGGLYYFSNREGRIRRLAPGVYGLSNHLLDSPWPKVRAGKDGLAALLTTRGDELVARLFALLADRRQSPDELLPRTGVGDAWERLLSSAFVASPEYGTRSSTVILVGRDRRVLFVERGFAPGGVPGQEARHDLALAAETRGDSGASMTDLSPPTEATAERVLGPLCAAFADYPVMRHVLGPAGDYPERLCTLIGFFLLARVLRKDPILALYDGGEVIGVAICTMPGLEAPPDLEEARRRTWAELGDDARARYDEWVRVWATLAAPEPNLHVNMVGVPPRFQGRGTGRRLLERVHAMSRAHPGSRGVSLTTESERNVAYYERLGYRIVGHGRGERGVESWGFFRADDLE